MFQTPIEGNAAEIVVNSHLNGAPCFDMHSAYEPQARMYFDAAKITKDGLNVRDGLHGLKVFDNLPLEPYLIMTVFSKDVNLPEGEKKWTPALFTKAANDYFMVAMRGELKWKIN
jgi:hypothetical protein